MTLSIQYIITGIALGLALCYAFYRIYKVGKQMDDPCYGCKGCTLKQHHQRGDEPEVPGICYKKNEKSIVIEKKK